MESFNVESRVPESIEFSSEVVGVKDEGVESRERGLPDQVHPGLEAISEQNFRKRIRNGYDQFSLHSTLRRSPRLLQSAANSTIVMEAVSYTHLTLPTIYSV